MNDTVQSKSFASKARDLLWPIYGNEHKIWLPMASMVGLILFNYTVARNMKDGLVITATGSSEIIPYLKGAVVLPMALVFFFIYAKLSSLLNKRALFYTIIGGFLAFFVFFAAVLYPLHPYLHPTESADKLQAFLPSGLRGLVDVYRVWTFSLFYTMSELWGAAVSALMFWQFANDVIRVTDAKRFYPHFYLLANVFTALSGVVVNQLSQVRKGLPEGVDPWGVSINYLTAVMTFCGFLVLAIYFYLNKYVFNDEYLEKVALERKQKPKKTKLKLSVMDGIKHLIRSKYLGLIALLVICYGITINFVEVTWKGQVGKQFPTGNEYTAFMGYLSTSTGIATIIAIFVGSILVRKLGWRFAALATPVVLGATGVLFFLCVLSPELVSPLGLAFGISPLFLGVLIGLSQNVLSKSIKYALFDPTKEMAYIPLDDESKMRGKAAVDVVANRFGKSGGGYIQIALFALVGPLSAVVPHLTVIFSIFIVIWIFAVVALSKKFEEACKAQEDQNN
ncbi:MAG: NTP/NDP exchange transporter [Myxococcales bacterium]|nr:NTP/NDP exchange transporter [Myxococcales bacterium]USN51624.1 MAG: NTP/NDP exchange transporter [Myxococcales bacterium]